MALIDVNNLTKGTLIQLGNRNDLCELCKREIKGKNDIDFNKKLAELRGKEEGKPMLKLKVSGAEVCICLSHIHKIAKENPLDEE